MWLATLHEIFGVVTRYNAIVMTNRQVEKINRMSQSTEKNIPYYTISFRWEVNLQCSEKNSHKSSQCGDYARTAKQ